jgi:hypothetical protein
MFSQTGHVENVSFLSKKQWLKINFLDKKIRNII